jgi:peptidoglycan/xylan/chitin deacetylase (PgdA/CDA1 family)
MSVSIKSFKEQIRVLSEDKEIEIISLNSLTYHSLWNRNGVKLKIAITFDDGYKDNLYVAAPILAEYGSPFTVFITTKFVDNNSSVYLTPEELRELSALQGVTIGSHGMTHARLSGLSHYELCDELVESRSRIEDIIDKKVQMFSYPHGSFDRRIRDAAVEAGYLLGFGSRFGINSKHSDPMFLRRTEIWAVDSENIFRQKYSGAWDWYGYYQKLRGL